MTFPSSAASQHRLRPVGYSDLDGRPAFKLALQEVAYLTDKNHGLYVLEDEQREGRRTA